MSEQQGEQQISMQEGSPGLGVLRAINRVQAELAELGMGKDGFNEKQKFRFRSIDQAYNVVSSVIAKHGLVVLPRYRDLRRDERKSSAGGALFVTDLWGDFELIAVEDGSSRIVTFPGEAMDSGDKSTNKAMSAAIKYALIQTFQIPTEGDNDADATTHEVAPRAQATRQQQPQQSRPQARNPDNTVDLQLKTRVDEVLRSMSEDVRRNWLQRCKDKFHVPYSSLSTSQLTELEQDLKHIAA